MSFIVKAEKFKNYWKEEAELALFMVCSTFKREMAFQMNICCLSLFYESDIWSILSNRHICIMIHQTADIHAN